MKFSRHLILFSALVATLFIYASCQDKEVNYEINTLDLPSQAYNYTSNSILENNLNPITNNGATLGRVLFYDKNLSINNTIACASCHKQQNGFADTKAKSEGFKGGLTKRNSLALVNLSDDNGLFWDKRVSNLEDLALEPVANHIEMGLDNTDNLLKKLNQTTYYPSLFEKAFGSKDITKDRISKALAQFLRSITSSNTKYDSRFNNTIFTDQETAGMNLFFNKLHCSSCHSGNDFNRSSSANIGLEKDYKDNGIGALTGDATQNGVFKVPTLRNIALTAPYMHDGRFNTLEEVVEHYNSGVKTHNQLSSFLRGFLWTGNGGTDQSCWSCGTGTGGSEFVPLNMSATEKQELVAFLKSLTDLTLTNDVRFSNPFKN